MRQPRAVKLRPVDGVEAPGHLEVHLGEAAHRMVGQRELHLIPAVQEDVGMVVGLFGDVGDPVDARNRLVEVLEAQLADDLIALPLPGQTPYPCSDLFLVEYSRHVSSLSASVHTPTGAWSTTRKR